MSHRSHGGILVAAATLLLFSFNCSSGRTVEPEKRPVTKSSTEHQPTGKDRFEVPDGTVEELQKYIEGLKEIQPSSSLRPAVAELHKKRAAAQLTACNKILAAQPTPEQVLSTVRLKLSALAALSRLGDEAAQASLESFPAEVETLGLKDMVRSVRLTALECRGEQAAAMSDRDYSRFIVRLAAFLTEGPDDLAAANLAVSVALAAEQSGRAALAVHAYRDLGKILTASKDEKVAATGAPMLGAARRLELVGKPFLLEGATVEGRPLDPKKFRGKVVLVDFFATWCGPCREEIPNIARCYRAYRKRGFEVLGISIDRDRKAIEEYVQREKHPWTILLDRNEARGTDKSLATYYGIFTIPQMILLDKNGKVLSLNVRGKQLRITLEELFGPSDPESSDKGKSGPGSSKK